MDAGVHLPLIDFSGDMQQTFDDLRGAIRDNTR